VTSLSPDAEDLIFAINILRSIKLKTGRRATAQHIRAQQRVYRELRVSRVVAIVENYLLMKAVRQRKPEWLMPVPPGRADKMTIALHRARMNIAGLVRFWKNELNVDLERLKRWTEFIDLRHLRHVLVHRLGLWQPALDPKPNLAERIRMVSTDPDLYRGPIPLDETDLDQAIALSLEIMKSLETRRLR